MKSIVKVLSNEKVDLNIKICQLVHLKKDNIHILINPTTKPIKIEVNKKAKNNSTLEIGAIK